MFSTTRITLGIDVGRDALKVAVVEPEKGRVLDMWTAPTVPERHSRQQPPEQDQVADRLKQMLAQAGSRRFKAIAGGVQGAGTLYGYLELPRMTESELAVAVPAAVRSRHPYSRDGLSVSYVRVPLLRPDSNRQGVFYVGASRQSVEALTSQLKSCGVPIKRVETNALALVREYTRNHPPSARFTALVHTGFELTQVVLVRDIYPYYVRDFALAGRDFTYAVQMGRQCTWAEAETYKRSTSAAAREVMLEPFVQRWLGEVRTTLDSAREQLGVDVERVVMSGRSARWQGLDERLSEHLELPVERDAWECLLIQCFADTGLEYRVAVGLALGA